MYLAIDVHYGDAEVVGAGVGFTSAGDAVPAFEIVQRFEGSAPAYEPGNFQARELPYLFAVARAADTAVLRAILIDGNVWLGPDRPGLGHHLSVALAGAVPIIGVAKSKFVGAPAAEVLRGSSASPLYVTSMGIEVEDAADLIRTLHGPYRLPTMLKRADQLCRAPSRT